MSTPTIRENILQAILANLRTMEKGVDGYSTKFSLVTREPIDKVAPGKRAALGVYEGDEAVTPNTYPKTTCRLQVLFEFHVMLQNKEIASEVLNEVLGDVKRRVMLDRTCGGWAIDVTITGSELEIEGQYDRQCSGLLRTEVLFQHHANDPRERI